MGKMGDRSDRSDVLLGQWNSGWTGWLTDHQSRAWGRQIGYSLGEWRAQVRWVRQVR